MLRFCIVELYCGNSGKIGYYNSQEIGIAKGMKKLGYECFVFYPSFEKTKAINVSSSDGITIVKCHAQRIGMHARYDWNILLEYKIDVAHIDGDNQMFAPDVIRFCRKHGIIHYTYSGSLESGATNFIKKAMMSLMLARNVKEYKKTVNFAKTEYAKKELEKNGIERVPAVVPVGLDLSIIPSIQEKTEKLRESHNIPLDKTVLLFVGRIDEYKHPLDILTLINKLPETYYSIIIGDGELANAMEDGIHVEKLENRVLWIKSIPNQEIHSYYALADYLLNFNPKEIFGMCILEALYQGCTVIAIHAPGPDLILKENHGYLVSDLNEMKNTIIKGNRLDAMDLKNYVINNFSWDNAVRQFDNYIKKCL